MLFSPAIAISSYLVPPRSYEGSPIFFTVPLSYSYESYHLSPQNLRHLDDVDVFTANSFACQSNGAFSAQGVSAMTVFSLAIAVFNGSDDNTVINSFRRSICI